MAARRSRARLVGPHDVALDALEANTTASPEERVLEFEDKVMAGLRGSEIEPALELIRSLRDEGMTIVAVEHIVKVILSVSDEVLVLHEGRELTRGKPAEVVKDERVIEAYLGQRYAKRMAGRNGDA
jgi:ABC-type branched-subunit amino acid transport system ATPase component